MMIDARRGTRDLAVICLRVEIDDSKAILKQIDARNEALTLDTILVEVGRVAVRSGDKDNTV